MANSRREELKAHIGHTLDSALTRLTNIWDDIGIIPEQRQERTDVVLLHITNLLDEMVREENTLKTKLLANVDKYGEELLRLCNELLLPPHEPDEGMTILQLEKNLRTRVDAMSKEKHDRLKKLKKMRETDQHLCDIMCTTPYYVPSGIVPSKEQLEGLDKHIRHLTDEKERRHNIFKKTKENIIKLMEDLEQCPETSFQRDIVCEEEESFLLSADNMAALKHLHDELEIQQKEIFSTAVMLRERMNQLWSRIEVTEDERNQFNTKHAGYKPKTIIAIREEIARCELLKLQNIQTVIERTRKELEEWWDKCYFSSEERAKFKEFQDEEMSEDLLERHDREVEKVKLYYEENKEMLQNVSRRQKLWMDFLEAEKRANDPARLFNRKFNLLKEESARKRIQKELPKVEQEVKEQIDAWEKATGREFLVSGQRFMDFIQRQWDDFKVHKEAEKIQRLQAKKQETELEMIYGSKPVTPAKRRFPGTGTTPGGKTPNKIRKVGDKTMTPKTPLASVSRLGRTNHSSLFSPIYMGPRSKTPLTRQQNSRPGTAPRSTRKALGEKNGRNGSQDTLFSQTTVSSGTSKNSETIASIGPYQDFASGLNQTARPNCRSSILPKQAYF